MVDIISREEWGAKYETRYSAPLPAEELWLHHSVTLAPDLLPPFTDDDAAVRTLERIGRERFGSNYGISYSAVVTPVGRKYDGHGMDRQGAHTKNRNSKSRSIVWVGNYDVNEPPESLIQATAELVAYGHLMGWWPDQITGGHRDAPGSSSTACPGRFAHALIPEINRRARAILNGDGMSWDSPTIPDYYRGAGETEQRPDLPSPRVALGWAVAHAANADAVATDARNHARAANHKIEILLDKLDVIEEQLEQVSVRLDSIDATRPGGCNVIVRNYSDTEENA